MRLLVLACVLAEPTWPENSKRRQLFRKNFYGP
ncbi:hypothetical protein GQ55_5G536900 [Panicum hallii var. hallii]|uniref:Uncharacterized protein n=1 Tax=Panicum hallii var. hallii TaxID=1504633 RepID=A0A2T7DT83_9POAL|nr:hypothetical protein GQ55_5G536900 [Panicum hallii var. hallii]